MWDVVAISRCELDRERRDLQHIDQRQKPRSHFPSATVP
jgi:hypothetical protein